MKPEGLLSFSYEPYTGSHHAQETFIQILTYNLFNISFNIVFPLMATSPIRFLCIFMLSLRTTPPSSNLVW